MFFQLLKKEELPYLFGFFFVMPAQEICEKLEVLRENKALHILQENAVMSDKHLIDSNLDMAEMWSNY